MGPKLTLMSLRPLAGPTGGPAANLLTTKGGTFVALAVGDALALWDYTSAAADPVKTLHVPLGAAAPAAGTPGSGGGLCLAHTSQLDGLDLVVGTPGGDIWCVSLRAQLGEAGRKITGGVCFNKDGAVAPGACRALAWSPRADGVFVAASADGCVYVYDRSKDAAADPGFPPHKPPEPAVAGNAALTVCAARSSKAAPQQRWRLSTGPVHALAFSPDGESLAACGRDGTVRVLDWPRPALTGGFRTCYGAALCVAWSPDGALLAAGGEDDVVSLYSVHDHAVVAWLEGHASFVSAVAFDPWWGAGAPLGGLDREPPPEGCYRLGSSGQDAQLLLWDIQADDLTAGAAAASAAAAAAAANVVHAAGVPIPGGGIRRAMPARPHGSHGNGLHALGGGGSMDIDGPTTAASASAAAATAAAAPIPWPMPPGGESPLPGGASGGAAIVVPSPPRAEVVHVTPTTAHALHADPLSGAAFTAEAVLTACYGGTVRVWLRPHVAELVAAAPGRGGGFSAGSSSSGALPAPSPRLVAGQQQGTGTRSFK